jgi:hypothetical protein
VRGQISAPVPIGLALAGVGLALSISGVVPPVDMKAAGFGAPIATVLVSAAISCGMILFFEGVQHRIPERAGRIVTLLAGVALPVILGHALFIAIGRAVGAPSIAIFTAALLVPMLAGLVLARFRVGRLFV